MLRVVDGKYMGNKKCGKPINKELKRSTFAVVLSL
jgi:hypothetical protein